MVFTHSLAKYVSDNFIFYKHESLLIVCNAPTNRSGVYIVYAVSNNQKELIYIGCSGHIKNNGEIRVRTTGGGGLKGRIVNGHQFRDKRFRSWPKQMEKEGIDALHIFWYATHDDNLIDSPAFVEISLLHEYYKTHKKLPKWNQKL